MEPDASILKIDILNAVPAERILTPGTIYRAKRTMFFNLPYQSIFENEIIISFGKWKERESDKFCILVLVSDRFLKVKFSFWNLADLEEIL